MSNARMKSGLGKAEMKQSKLMNETNVKEIP